MPPPELTLKARYVFPVDGPPIESGAVRVAADKISYVGPVERSPDEDFGNAAIVPGFVNAHTHLELSGLRAKDLGGGSFVDWLRRVIDARRGQDANAQAHAVQRGIDASLAAGTTLVGDISTGGRSWRELLRSPLRATVFCEVLGLRPKRAEETTRAARQFLEWTGCTSTLAVATTSLVTPHPESCDPQATPAAVAVHQLDALPSADGDWSARRLQPGISPHAPYSADPRLYELAALWSRSSRLPVCTHLAETREELRLLSRGDGPLRDFLSTIGAWPDDWLRPGPSPVDYVLADRVGHANWLLAHGNYLTPSEIAQLAATPGGAGSCSVVFCPRTHFYFGHARHPYPAMLAAGMNVCLGTDSLASSPTLSMLDEMRFLRLRDPQLSGGAILSMGTLGGARSLGREKTCGSLTPGKCADLAVVRLPDRDDADPHGLLLDSNLPVARTFIGGRPVFRTV